ncbi:hypothetical protein Ancab_039802 [Ancistrocladus abbreviatus]
MRLLLNLLYIIVGTLPLSFSLAQPSCHDDERSALLEFKSSISINKSAFSHPSAYPKIASWKPTGKGSDCCMWDGVECDGESGHVTSLDLSSSCLYGPIHANSTLFNLVHLQTLNLANNNFRHSLIPPQIGLFSNLSYLNLSQSYFFGQVPVEISKLSKLITLDLSKNVDPLSGAHLLELRELSLETLAQTSTSLKILELSKVSISSQVPMILANLSSLTSLLLDDTDVYGAFPEGIFLLPNPVTLDISENSDLVGFLPEFSNGSKIQSLNLRSTGFYGKIPASLSNLGSLTAIHIINCSFHGTIPYSLGKLTQLRHLGLSYNNLEGQIPSSLANLTLLYHLALGYNKLTGEIPSFIANFSQLTVFDLGYAHLQGPVPAWFSRLKSLQFLGLGGNNFIGPVELDIFLQLNELQILDLSNINLIAPTKAYENNTYPQFVSLFLPSTNLRKIPDFLANQTKLQYLDLAHNGIQGSLIFPSTSLLFYDLSYNKITGDIPPSICNATSLYILDLIYNNLSGEIPPCIGNLGNSLSVLNLHSNNLQGTIPDTFTNTCNIKWIDLSNNQLHGQIPRSVANCSSLQILALRKNQMDGIFPIWLGDLPKLHALILGSNKFRGVMPSDFGLSFPSLQVLDLSDNRFTGNLPGELFINRPAMEAKRPMQTSYLLSAISDVTSGMQAQQTCVYTFTLTNKDREELDAKVLNIFTSIDLSKNSFTGRIPDSIGNLVGLESLNLSHNYLTAGIPSTIASLTDLESLDLSHNMLSGEIPQQLTALTFLEIFSVAYNNLTGAIPQGKQFSTFENDSFKGNTGLCGSPLSNKCRNFETSLTPQGQRNSTDKEDEELSPIIDWLAVSMGYLTAFLVAAFLGHLFTNKRHDWFVELAWRMTSR